MPIEIKSLDGKVLKIVTGDNLRDADLRNVDLRDADLRNVDLRYADLYGTNLRDASLRYASLRYADLYGANLRGANLRGVNLRNVDLRYADLYGTDLRGADLRGADLRDADLYGANLRGANLQDANLRGVVLPEFQIPQDIEIIGYKKISTGVITLKIPAESRRTASLVSDKCRCEFAIMVEGKDGESLTPFYKKLQYTLGEVIRSDDYNDDIRMDCTNGVHFFMNCEDAEEFSF